MNNAFTNLMIVAVLWMICPLLAGAYIIYRFVHVHND